MFLILSAAYIDQELKSEFGALPPAFLPIGNQRLFHHQIQTIPEGEKIYLSLPESFSLSSFDSHWLKLNQVSIIGIPDNLRLGESIVTALNLIEEDINTNLHILHGDTLSLTIPKGNDIVGIAQSTDNYNWAVSSSESFSSISNEHDLDDGNNVIMGYFSFSKPKLLIQSIIKAKWDFIKGLNIYHQQQTLDSVRINGWLDFGHVNTFYQSKSRFTTQRAFNNLHIKQGVVVKSSDNENKVRAESNWFKQVPPALRIFLPQYLGEQIDQKNQFSYQLEYLHHTSLNELFVFSTLPDTIWNNILNKCLDFINSCHNLKAPEGDNNHNTMSKLLQEKTSQRIIDYCHSKKIDPDEKWIFNSHHPCSINEIIQYCKPLLPPDQLQASIMHGDFCFSNILFDFRSNSIKTYDPRAIDTTGRHTLYGDVRYDIAKLSHSIIGLYDAIIAGYFNLELEQHKIIFDIPLEDNKRAIGDYFIHLIKTHYNVNAAQIYAMQIHLFLSMLSLHADNEKRQMALFANAFRLYHLLLENKL